MNETRCNASPIWRGHRFEARYDEGAVPEDFNWSGGTAGAMIAIMHAAKPRAYVRDVCVRCGRTVERQTTPFDLSMDGLRERLRA